MKLLLKLLLLLLLLVGCKTKHVQIEQKEEKHKEIKKSEKDSAFEQEKQGKMVVFELDNSQVFELDLETADGLGYRELTFERIRSPAGEKIIVRGGKVRLRASANTSEKITKKDTLQVNSTSVRTNIQENKATESKSFNKQKEVKTQGFTFGGYLLLIFWILVLGALIFLAWRLKLFRKITAIITKFKRLLKNI